MAGRGRGLTNLPVRDSIDKLTITSTFPLHLLSRGKPSYPSSSHTLQAWMTEKGAKPSGGPGIPSTNGASSGPSTVPSSGPTSAPAASSAPPLASANPPQQQQQQQQQQPPPQQQPSSMGSNPPTFRPPPMMGRGAPIMMPPNMGMMPNMGMGAPPYGMAWPPAGQVRCTTLTIPTRALAHSRTLAHTSYRNSRSS